MTHFISSQAKESTSSCKWSISEAYFLTPEQPSYQTPEFPVPQFPGCFWSVELYPNGTKSDNAGNLSLYFHCRVNQSLITHVSFATEGTGYEETFTFVFEKDNPHGQGYPSYMPHDELLNPINNHLVDGKVTVVCDVKFVSLSEPPILLTGNSNLMKNRATTKFLPQLLQQYGEEMSDCCLKVGDEEFKTYRLILSLYSPVFKTMFTVPMEENRNGVVKIVDFTPEAVKTAINFFYTSDTGEIESPEQLEELFRFSDKYDIAALKEYLETESISKLSDQNCCTLLQLAVQSNAFTLKEACFTFLEECIMAGLLVQNFDSLDGGIVKEIVVSAMKKRHPVVNNNPSQQEENNSVDVNNSEV